MKTAAGFLQAGACAVGIGAALVPAALVREKRFGDITDRASELLKSVQQ
jgi:2-keto-3-deoxy-6-phosphogluconate aldolase